MDVQRILNGKSPNSLVSHYNNNRNRSILFHSVKSEHIPHLMQFRRLGVEFDKISEGDDLIDYADRLNKERSKQFLFRIEKIV